MERAQRTRPSWHELGFWTEAEFANLRGVQIPHLRNERTRGAGPPFARVGRRTVYPIDAARAWIAAHVVARDTPPTLTGGQKHRRTTGSVSAA